MAGVLHFTHASPGVSVVGLPPISADRGSRVAAGAEMFLSVRVERVSDLPDDQSAIMEFLADGTVVFYMDHTHITAEGAEALQAVMATARCAYHEAWGLPVAAPLAS